jgi:hypothetical protein
MSLSRPTATMSLRKLGCTLGAAAVVLGVSSASALADPTPEAANLATVAAATPVQGNAAPASCPGQTFSQPFAALEDGNYYTLVPGSEFNSGPEGWELIRGAHLTRTQQPEGGNGFALELPAGSIAISPPVCVTLQYPTARVWTRSPQGNDNVVVATFYEATHSVTQPQPLSSVAGTGGEWQLSEPFAVDPELGGKSEEAREVRFVFAPSGHGRSSEIYGVWVDPRMV